MPLLLTRYRYCYFPREQYFYRCRRKKATNKLSHHYDISYYYNKCATNGFTSLGRAWLCGVAPRHVLIAARRVLIVVHLEFIFLWHFGLLCRRVNRRDKVASRRVVKVANVISTLNVLQLGSPLLAGRGSAVSLRVMF